MSAVQALSDVHEFVDVAGNVSVMIPFRTSSMRSNFDVLDPGDVGRARKIVLADDGEQAAAEFDQTVEDILRRLEERSES